LYLQAFVIPIFTFVASACVVPEKHRKEIETHASNLYGMVNQTRLKETL
jgi:hypothetical protein